MVKWSSESLYDLSLQSYISLNYQQFFIIISTIVFFKSIKILKYTGCNSTWKSKSGGRLFVQGFVFEKIELAENLSR